MRSLKNAVMYVPYVYLNISSVLWGGWIGTLLYSKSISYLQNISDNKNKYEISISGLITSGVMGGVLSREIIYKYLLPKP